MKLVTFQDQYKGGGGGGMEEEKNLKERFLPFKQAGSINSIKTAK